MHYTVVVIGSIIAYLNFEKHHEEIVEETLLFHNLLQLKSKF